MYRRIIFFLVFVIVPVSYANDINNNIQIYSGPRATLSENPSGNKDWDIYRKKASLQKINFAGHYVIFTAGCGGGAICGEVFDVISGKIVSTLPDEYIENDNPDSVFDIYFKPNSSILEVSGLSANDDTIYKSKKYQFNNNKFKSIKD